MRQQIKIRNTHAHTLQNVICELELQDAQM